MRMVIKKIKTTGMHCPSCEKIIENTVLSVKGVKSVKSDYSREETITEFDESITDIDNILKEINNKGYKSKIMETQKKTGSDEYYSLNLAELKPRYLLIAGTLLVIFGIFRLTKYSFSFSLPEITPNMGLAIIFVIGILTSVHCVGMCSGFVLSYTTKEAMYANLTKKSRLISHLKYGGGKTITYAILGALSGLFGSFIAFTPKMKGIAALIAGLFLITYGLNTIMVFPWLRKLQLKSPKFLDKINAGAVKGNKGPFVIGLLNGLMIACGPLQAMLIYAAGTGSIMQGALSMLVFGLGTLPLMLGFGSLATMLGSKFTHNVLKISAAIVIILGFVMVNRGLTLTGAGYDFNTLITNVRASGNGITGAAVGFDTTFKEGYQEIRMEVNRHGWEPDKFILKKGVPVKWVINGKEISRCNKAIQAPKLGLNFDITPGEQVIEFTPTEEGTIPFSCWMGMISGVFIVKEDIDFGNKEQLGKEIEDVKVPQKSSCGGRCGSNSCGATGSGSCGCKG